MRLDSEFIRLPLRFDPERLAAEVSQFEEAEWKPHPQGFAGNCALSLIALAGDPHSDDVSGPMRPTPHLDRCPYIRQVLASFHSVWGRTRLMRIDGNGEAGAHADVNYYWAQRARVHVPILTGPDVRFECGSKSVHMGAGEAWIFDTWRRHNVTNPHPTRRIHLVADTVGSAAFWSLARRGDAEGETIAWNPLSAPSLALESVNRPLVMTPHEMRAMIGILEPELGASADGKELLSLLSALHEDWLAAWTRFGESHDAWPLYAGVVDRVSESVASCSGRIKLANGIDAADAAKQLILEPAIDREKTRMRESVSPSPSRARSRRFERPVFLVCPPRSGSSLLFETLSQSPAVWTIGGESHALFEGIRGLHPAQRRYHSNRLAAADATPTVIARLERALTRSLRNRTGQAPRAGATSLRLLEKTPKNSLRVPFLTEAFPDAVFVYLYRDMRDTISSMLDAWRSGKFVTYPDLPDWDGPPWSLLLTPGWRELSGRSLAEIVAAQWSTATRYLLDDLEHLPPEQWCVASYQSLVEEPRGEIERICRFVGLDWDRDLESPLPLSRSTLTAPSAEKWKRNAADLELALPLVADIAERARALFASAPRSEGRSAPAGRSEAPTLRAPVGGHDSMFRSVATNSFAELLDKTGSSLLVTTYQSGRVVLLRAVEGTLNTHLKQFQAPMGAAIAPHGIALGVSNYVWYFRSHPALARRLGDGRADAAFVPASAHATGDIRIHELVWAGRELVIVNTRFSCLAKIDATGSFVPIWKPAFITDLVPEDRCHLNGVAVVDGKVRWATALAESNEKDGWRARKGSGGIVFDVASNEIVVRGLSMPHSPRWHDGRLWVLESGEGRLSAVDPATGAITPVAEVPGFARGLAFLGRYALIGLSQIRESVFDGLPIAAKSDRSCGVWIVDLVTGGITGFLRFEGGVQEIFDIQLLEGIRYPELLEPGDPAVGAAFVLPSLQEKARPSLA